MLPAIRGYLPCCLADTPLEVEPRAHVISFLAEGSAPATTPRERAGGALGAPAIDRGLASEPAGLYAPAPPTGPASSARLNSMLILSKQRRLHRCSTRAASVSLVVLGLSSARCGAEPATEDEVAQCHAPASAPSAPGSIEEVTALVNALSQDHDGRLELSCFVESLERPLGVMASAGVFSAQPAVDERTPRILLWSGGLILTVVPAGDGRDLLELSVPVSSSRSIKAEIKFPVVDTLSEAAPYDHIVRGNSTKCSLCHGSEQESSRVTSTRAFESNMLKPAERDEVDLAFVEAESKACDARNEPERCAILRAVFGQGGLQPRRFDDDVRTIYGD
jgi:hypothetical protein